MSIRERILLRKIRKDKKFLENLDDLHNRDLLSDEEFAYLALKYLPTVRSHTLEFTLGKDAKNDIFEIEKIES